jgi:hypothetical protein
MKWYLLIAVCVLSSCRIQRKIYSPLPVNNPSLQEKNDYSVNATISTPQGFDLNGGYAITNRFAIIGGLYTHKNRDLEQNSGFTNQVDSSTLLYRHNGFTLGTGIYFPIFGRESDNYLSFYGGINNGSFKMDETLYKINPSSPSGPFINTYKSKLNRFFLQGSFTHYGKIFEASFTTRFNFVTYKNIKTDYTDTQLQDYQLPPFIPHRTNSFADFSFDSKFYFSRDPGWGIHFFGLTSTRLGDDEVPNFHYYPFRLGTGIFFRGFSRKPAAK